MEASLLLKKDYAIYSSEELSKLAMDLKSEKELWKVKGGLEEILSRLKTASSYSQDIPSFIPVLEYAQELYSKPSPTHFELLVLSSRLSRLSSSLQNRKEKEEKEKNGLESKKIRLLEKKSFESVREFEKRHDFDSLLHLAENSGSDVAVSAVRALGRIGNSALLKKACFLRNLDAAFEAVLQLEKMNAQTELTEVALKAQDAVALKALDSLFRLRSIDGLLAVAMRGKDSLALLAVKYLERLGAASALKAVSLLSSSAGKAAYQALVRRKMAGHSS